jgi:hypothetical protein
MNRSQRNNNPGNLVFAGQKEAVGKDDKGFAVFPDAPAGWRALHTQIKLDARRGLSLQEFIAKYAPPYENDTRGYLKFVCNELKESPLVLLKEVSVYALAGVMAQMEGYYHKNDKENV